MSENGETKQCRICECILSASSDYYPNRAVCKFCLRGRAANNYRVSKRAVKCPCCESNLTLIRYQKKNGLDSDQVLALETAVQ